MSVTKDLKKSWASPIRWSFSKSPYRIIESLEDILSILGNRGICVAREMTKMFEEYWRGNVSGALAYFNSQAPRGEFTLVVEGKKDDGTVAWTEEQMRSAIERELKTESSAKEIPSVWRNLPVGAGVRSIPS